MTRVTLTLSFTTYGGIDVKTATNIANNFAQELSAHGQHCDTIRVKVRAEKEAA